MPELRNWNEQIRFTVPEGLFKEPTTIAEVQAIVRQAVSDGRTVTVVGALHSTTECMVGTGVVISMAKMNRILDVNAGKLEVTVEGGVTLHQLCQRLKANELQSGVILEFGNFQIGAISGTHANDTSVSREAQFSSFVIGAKLVTPSGDFLEISQSQNSNLLPYIRSHFGMFGVVCEVTLRVFPNRPLRITHEVLQIETFLNAFDAQKARLKAEQDQVFGMLFPHTGKLIWQCRKFVDPRPPGLPAPEDLDDFIQRRGINFYKEVLLPLVKTAGRRGPVDQELLSRALIETSFSLIGLDAYRINPCDRGITYAEHDPDFDFYDWVFPESRWCDMVRDFLGLAERFRAERNFALPLPALIYFIRQDQASMLSRSRTEDMMAVDPTYPDPAEPLWLDFRLAFNELAMGHGGIPHINKTRGGAITHYARACDQAALRDYLARRKQHDPNDTFLNAHYRQMFEDDL